jgi:nuclear pore complex protein Nup62
MIESVNELSVSTGHEASDKGDPLTQIAEVLNEHLASLTWIDGAIDEMESKLSQVKPRLLSLNGPTTNGSSTRRAPSGYRPQ